MFLTNKSGKILHHLFGGLILSKHEILEEKKIGKCLGSYKDKELKI